MDPASYVIMIRVCQHSPENLNSQFNDCEVQSCASLSSKHALSLLIVRTWYLESWIYVKREKYLKRPITPWSLSNSCKFARQKNLLASKQKQTLNTLDTTHTGISYDTWIPAVSNAGCILPLSDPTFNMAPINQFPISFSENYWRPS